MELLGWFVALVVAVVVVVRTAGRRAERALQPGRADAAHTVGPGHPLVELRRLIDDLPEAILLFDGDGIVSSANRAAAMLTRRSVSGVAGISFHEVIDSLEVDPLSDDAVRRWWEQIIGGGEPGPVLVTCHDLDGNAAVVECVARRSVPSATGTDGVPADPGGSDAEVRVVVRIRDVSERERSTTSLEQARRRFHQAFHSAPTGMALVRLDDGRLVDANQSLADMLGVESVRLVGRTLRELTHPDDVSDAVPHQARLELGIVDSYRLDQRYLRADGKYIWARTRVSSTEDDGMMLAITHIEDISEQRRTAELLTHAARHDELTGLPNRSFLMQLLTERLLDADPNTLAVLFIDLDHFKVVNDSLGHGAGDELLQAMADRLREVVRGADILARFGGDEFVVVLDGAGRIVDAHEVALRVRRAFLAPVTLGENELVVTASIGYSTNAEPGLTPNDLLRYADAAMYRAKARGRDAIEAFDVADPAASALALRTANELRRGLERGELVPYFQPIVDLTSGTVLGYEVLARWLHPDRGLLAPSEFLALAEETGQMVELGATMLRDSLSQLARWRAAGHDFARGSIAVNVGTRQLIDPDFYHLVADVLAETGIDADSLWLEITETSLLADVKTVSVALRQLRSLGLHLSVDDFGTGYSSLTYLKRFPVEAIKIDRAFVGGLGLENDDTTIVDAVVQLGQALGLAVVAEGVETPLQLSMLRELGCDRGQGYLFGRPRPGSLIESERLGAAP